MDFEKAYKEALERAKAGKPLDEVFPELKESGDERIIEELIGHCKDLVRMNQDDKVMLSVYEPWLVWLERQKEYIEDIRQYAYNKGLVDAMEKQKDKVVEFDHDKEQKPAEWSEEEMRKIVELKFFITQCNGFNKENRKKAFDMIDALHPRSHWKPSEDEERLINTSISFLKDFADKGYENAVECIDWLKSKLNGNSGK